MAVSNDVLKWLLNADPAIRWQVMKNLIGSHEADAALERKRISVEGWGAKLLSHQDDSGMWGGGLYSPKWISTTYSLLVLRRLGLDPCHPQALRACQLLLDKGLYRDGGINYFASLKHSETCVTGMVLSIVAYFEFRDGRVRKLVEHLLAQQMLDGGWNCQSYQGATHSSFHTTICVLEGLREYQKRSPVDKQILDESQTRGREFLLNHRLFRSHKTGEVVDIKMTRFSFPPRWRYDIMRSLDYFQECNAPRDSRMEDAIALIKKKSKKDGRWVLQQRHPGKTFFEMEPVGKASRWNTLRALRILQWYEA